MSLIPSVVISQKHVSLETCRLWCAMSLCWVRNATGGTRCGLGEGMCLAQG